MQQKYQVRTPFHKEGIKRLARRTYRSLASTIISSPDTCKPLILELSRKMKEEMKVLASNKHDSILRDTNAAVKHFHWETVMLEYEKMVPVLVSLLKELIPNAAQWKPLICLIVSQLVKSRHQRLGLVQSAVSMMLYGNGSSKQVIT